MSPFARANRLGAYLAGLGLGMMWGSQLIQADAVACARQSRERARALLFGLFGEQPSEDGPAADLDADSRP